MSLEEAIKLVKDVLDNLQLTKSQHAALDQAMACIKLNLIQPEKKD